MARRQTQEEQFALALFERVVQANPQLRMTIESIGSSGGPSLHIPTQTGMAFDLWCCLPDLAYLQLETNGYVGEWGRLDDTDLVEEFEAAVLGLIAGSYRIEETVRRDKVVSSRLQRSTDSGWETVAEYSRWTLLPFGERSRRVVQNCRG